MKKSTIWILTVLMAITFIGLLYIELQYMNAMSSMRKQQFDQVVHRSMHAVAKHLEDDETNYFIEQNNVTSSNSMTKSRKKAVEYQFTSKAGVEGSLSIKGDADVISKIKDSEESDLEDEDETVVTEEVIQDEEENLSPSSSRYHQSVLEAIIVNISSQASNRPLLERADTASIKSYLAEELTSNGLNVPFEFSLVNRNGIPIYSTKNFRVEQSDTADNKVYKQKLFIKDPEDAKVSMMVYFPTKDRYVFKSLRILIPAFIFTIILLGVLIYVLGTAFRQKKINEMKNDFINNMTHEFKTPISTISLASQMLNDDSVRKSPAMMKHVSSIINDETKRLRFQVEKVLQMSMFDRKKATVRLQEVDVNALISNIINTFKIKVEKYGGTLTSSLDAEDSIVYVDEMHFTNVIFNLLDNAVKYRKEDVPLQLHISTADIANDRVQISIIDNGIGIKKEDLKRIFDKFYRVHTGNTHDVKGFGLGLAYVHKMISILGGTIKVESEFRHGTKFIITLPITKN